MKLVLAEKPSVAQSIAKVLGAAKREDGYLEGNGYVVSWCVGHLVELAQPEAYDAKYSKWAYADLPIFPKDWRYEVSAGTKKQFGILKKLMAREDVASLVCATDAGREGELIFRLVYHKAGCRKPFERLWISSMEDVAIKEGFENLKSGTEYDALYEAALCRERADWIVGINATRLFSTLYGQTLNVGRVMTPTLAMAGYAGSCHFRIQARTVLHSPDWIGWFYGCKRTIQNQGSSGSCQTKLFGGNRSKS